MAVEFDRDRFKEAVLYIAWKTKDDPAFGRTKFAKTLFYADMETYAEAGEALTGARYEHWDYGPVPPVLYPVETALTAAGKAEVRMLEGRSEEKLYPLGDEPAFRLLSATDQYVLDARIRRVEEYFTTTLSDRSHEHPAWFLTGYKEEIPYHVGAISRRKPTDEDFKRANEIAIELGWK